MQQRSVNSTNTLVEQQSIASNGPLRPSGDYSALSPCASPTAPINTIDVNPNADHTQESRHRHDDASSSGFAGVPRAIKQLLSVSAFVNNDEGLIQLDMDGEGSKNGFFRRARARIGAAVKHDEPRHQVYTAQSDAEGRSTAETTLVASHVDKVKVDCKGTKGEPSARKLRKLEKSKRRVESRGVPVMNIVMFIVGSRGDVQPYIALALALIRTRDHRVRIASHGPHRKAVEEACEMLKGEIMNGMRLEERLDFFDAGGDPEELMAYMVKNPGLIPGMESLTNGDIQKKQDMTAQYIRGFYHSTYMPGESGLPFAADAIISNPPVFAHVHIAEALGLPLLMSFTMPWTPTANFSHPLVNLGKNTADKFLANYISFIAADALMWQGLGPVINEFREKELALAPLPDRFANNILDRLEIPWTYCWSPGLLTRPNFWRSNIDVTGFYFLENAKSYTPPKDLAEFLAAGKPPIYMGFGSVVIPDPERVTDIIVEAQSSAGCRLIVSSGWAKLGTGREDTKDIFWLSEGVPHDWLFAEERVMAVCHHGGAGTTAIGLKLGRPTIVIPFFGDQKFWGNHVHSVGAGPAPIPFKHLSKELLASAFMYVASDQAKEAAAEIALGINEEHGELKGVESFHRNMPLLKMRCDLDPSRTAVWYHKGYGFQLSAKCAGVLIDAGKLRFDDLELHRSQEHDTHHHHRDPLRGARDAFFDIFGTAGRGMVQMFSSPGKGVVSIVYGVPKAVFSIVGDVYEGINNLPAMMGSSTRRKVPVVSVGTGFSQAFRGLGSGIWDAYTGVFVEPIDGYMRQGPVGIPLGILRGAFNFVLRPAGGLFGLVIHPVQGISRHVYALATHRDLEPLQVLRQPRQAMSIAEAGQVGELEREAILAAYTRECKKWSTRRRWRREGKKVLLVPNKDERAWMKEDKDLRRVYKAGDHTHVGRVMTVETAD